MVRWRSAFVWPQYAYKRHMLGVKMTREIGPSFTGTAFSTRLTTLPTRDDTLVRLSHLIGVKLRSALWWPQFAHMNVPGQCLFNCSSRTRFSVKCTLMKVGTARKPIYLGAHNFRTANPKIATCSSFESSSSACSFLGFILVWSVHVS